MLRFFLTLNRSRFLRICLPFLALSRGACSFSHTHPQASLSSFFSAISKPRLLRPCTTLLLFRDSWHLPIPAPAPLPSYWDPVIALTIDEGVGKCLSLVLSSAIPLNDSLTTTLSATLGCCHLSGYPTSVTPHCEFIQNTIP